MAQINIDLLDGQPPVAFSLKNDDTIRFAAFMQKYNVLQTVVNAAYVRLDNTVAANAIPMPDHIRVQALCEVTESLRDELAPHTDPNS